MKNSILIPIILILLFISCKPKESAQNHLDAVVNKSTESEIPACYILIVDLKEEAMMILLK